VFNAYPHQLSGGQRQRVTIAQAIACRPALLLADEPTTALDTTTQAEILKLLGDLRQQHQMSMIFVSHDPAILSEVATRMMVMSEGRIVDASSLPDQQSLPFWNQPYLSESVCQ
jgi:ABC-type glutathione transport system ATPase component